MVTRFLGLVLASSLLATVQAADSSPGKSGAPQKNTSPPPSKPAITQFLDTTEGELAWLYQKKPILVYAFAAHQFKPYVRELYTLKGDNLLRDAPADHLHHHGLMYAIRVNGNNFWEEKPEPGYEKPVRLLEHTVGQNSDGLPQARLTQLVHWIPFKDRDAADTASVALLVERRTLTLTIDEKAQEVALQWSGSFEVGRNAKKVTLTGTDYNGLGLRLPESFDHKAVFQNSERLPYPEKHNRSVITGKWTSVSGAMDGREATLALFGSAANTRGDAGFFTMLDPFAYLAATQALDKSPLEYAAGDRFEINYLLVAYSEKKAPEFVNQRYRTWEARASRMK